MEETSKTTKIEINNSENKPGKFSTIVDTNKTDVLQAETQKGEEQQMSKKQRKKLQRRTEWLATKQERKQKQREKERQKRKERVLAGDEANLGPSRKKLKLCTMATSECKQRVVIDMSFDDYMHDRDLSKTVKQIQRCYCNNRREDNPMQFYVTSLMGKSLAVMERNNGFRNWDVNIKGEGYGDVFPKEELVYLSSDSENVIETLDPSKVYVIGGLVDHNNHKGLCHKLAVEKNIAHGKLPIDEYLNMKSRKVLTIDHVFSILLSVSHGKSWKDALLSVIPARKGAVELKENNGNTQSDAENENIEESDNEELDHPESKDELKLLPDVKAEIGNTDR